MLAHENNDIQEAVATVYQLTQEEKIRQQCEAREDYYRRTIGREELLRQTTQKLNQVSAELDQALAERDQLRQLLAKHGIDADEQID